jgi:hypothetical protein
VEKFGMSLMLKEFFEVKREKGFVVAKNQAGTGENFQTYR